jgi:3D (Asp-Asp-Asp) domain-containing protein
VAPANPGTFRALKHIDLIATGYSPDPRENGGYTVTATGLPIGYGAAAVDPRVIPLGTKLYVEGYGYAFACDVGGAIKGKRIDLAYDTYRIANTKGRRKVRVWILGP